jgi:hypothetical protein
MHGRLSKVCLSVIPFQNPPLHFGQCSLFQPKQHHLLVLVHSTFGVVATGKSKEEAMRTDYLTKVKQLLEEAAVSSTSS